MQFDARLTGDAAALAKAHSEVLDRLPATVHAFVLVELRKWSTLFAPEQRYQQTLVKHLAAMPPAELQQAVTAVARVEADAGVDKLGERDPSRFQDAAQALFRKRRLLTEWRKAIDSFFTAIDPALERQLHPPDAPRRLVVQIYGGDIAVQQDKLWSRFKTNGLRVPLALDGVQGPAFLRTLFAFDDESGRGLFGAMGPAEASRPETWIIESHDALHALCDAAARRPVAQPGPTTIHASSDMLTGLSYDRLAAYRQDLTRALYRKIQSGVESPQAFAAYARSLTIAPQPGVLIQPTPPVLGFVRDLFLTGNGTLFVNNTFVEWAAVQALRRAEPRVLVTRYGVRDRLKPFSSLLLFSEPRATDQIPLIEDPVGSFVDVEQLSYYVWLNAEKSAAYRNKTLYLFLAEGIDQMLAIRSDMPNQPRTLPAVSLRDVHATMTAWLGVPRSDASGRPIATLVS
jgi:hypothetical protein